MAERVAVLLDGEFVKKVLKQRLNRFPDVRDVMTEIARILKAPEVHEYALYRIFYYTADPLRGSFRHPLSGEQVDFGASRVFRENTSLIGRIENMPDMAVRRGTLVHQGWRLGESAAKGLLTGSKKGIEPEDIVARIKQSGVDVRIGLDIASFALKRLVSLIVLVTGDSDLVPAMKLARREGLRVVLDPLGRSVRPELKVHADRLIEVDGRRSATVFRGSPGGPEVPPV